MAEHVSVKPCHMFMAMFLSMQVRAAKLQLFEQNRGHRLNRWGVKIQEYQSEFLKRNPHYSPGGYHPQNDSVVCRMDGDWVQLVAIVDSLLDSNIESYEKKHSFGGPDFPDSQ